MLPLKLSISGLYSYQKKQTIDFEELTNAGLFGIFGAVGSGKSSILEAIGFVLYGDTERLNKTDKRSYNMLNLKSDKANIEFEFLNFEERKFKFVADWKRKKRFEETTSIERLAYEWKGEEWVPMNSADATIIIGLTYENFRRTIIIPQGKFKEFLDLKGKDRSDMMKEIFHLQRFDLASKVGLLQSTTRTKLDQLKGALSGFEAISADAILALEKEVIAANNELQNDKIGLSLVEKELSELNTLKANFEDLEKKQQQLSKLNAEKVTMNALELEIDLFEKTERNFKSTLITLKTEKTALEKAKENLVATENLKKLVVDGNLKSQNDLEIVQPDFDILEISKSKVSDLESIEKITIAKSALAVLDEKIKVEEALFLASEKKEKEVVAKLDRILGQLVDAKKKRLEASFLVDLGTWYQQQRNLQNNFDVLNIKLNSLKQELKLKTAAFLLLELPFDSWKNVLKTKVESIFFEKEKAIDIKTKLLVSKELVHYAENLHDGENCPLCGSQEHPNVMQGEDVSNQLVLITQTIADLANKEAQISLKQAQAEKLEFEINHVQAQLKGIIAECETIEKDQKMHLSNFIWKDFDAKNSQSFESTKTQQHLLEKEIVALENDENELRKEREIISLVLKNNNTSKGEFEAIKAAKSGAVANELSQLKVLSFADYESISAASIQAEKIVLHNKNIKIATDYQVIKEQIALQNQEIATLTGSLITLQLQVIENEKILVQTQKIIAKLLQEHSFLSVEEVRTILLKNWNIAAEKEKVKVFTGNVLIVINSVSEAEKLILGKTFENKILEEKTTQFSAFKLKFETQLGIVSALQDNLKRVQAQFVEKADLLAQFELLNTRATNLVTLANMFNASGFVNYVSSIYLQNLADVANVRFHRMTKNQLSLTINSSNEFEVIDYLNNGASRSVKTLSGGQGFQASLCLALALAESVQSLNQNDKNFFFIDEGFGTQDPESVAVVFETLQSLYKENRIVGIISHVAELQERIPRSINVFKQEEKGSVISESWN
ncbi:AAA family ATPase [Flavobacterium sandaracinum]|uniref:SMC family ATPase n=1 Tax=Flavobacterium sandaracinum TaxID=2541733 RepID=A0A4R5D230_9FLAO|nr:SMC family ATPase [Flavobacterium sandaracinum]TDE04253.1 SMC family ATPase [Flavobacterium sandaracinum]